MDDYLGTVVTQWLGGWVPETICDQKFLGRECLLSANTLEVFKIHVQFLISLYQRGSLVPISIDLKSDSISSSDLFSNIDSVNFLFFLSFFSIVVIPVYTILLFSYLYYT